MNLHVIARREIPLVLWIPCNLLRILERETGIEPVTSSLGSWRSTAELLPHPYENKVTVRLTKFLGQQ